MDIDITGINRIPRLLLIAKPLYTIKKMKKFYFIIICFLTILFVSCSKSIILNGTYQNNISPFGLSAYEVTFENNGVCNFKSKSHLQNTVELKGKYTIKSGRVYIRFIEPKKNKLIVDELTWTAHDEYESYELKKEKGIEFHYKYLIENQKLYVYRVDNGKLVKKVEHYNNEKGRLKTEYYLQKSMKN